jgi:bifunctional non-homologous end joining protein LigD
MVLSPSIARQRKSSSVKRSPRRTSELLIEDKTLQVSNLDKVLYPKTGFTKAQVINYYIQISKALLPHLEGRPLTLKRYPEGVEGPYFYEKTCPSHRPQWVKTIPVWSEHKQDHIHYCVANNLATLVWAANLADLELHTSLSRTNDIQRPTMMVFDLDPGPPADIRDCAEIALWLNALLKKLELKSFAKTSGSKGLQVYVPLNTKTSYEETKTFSKFIAESLERQHPKRVVSKMAKALRKGKVFVDWSQNDDHKTTVCVYSLRAKEIPTVSTPITWKEVERGQHAKLFFETNDVLKRVERFGDLFFPVLDVRQKLPKIHEESL